LPDTLCGLIKNKKIAIGKNRHSTRFGKRHTWTFRECAMGVNEHSAHVIHKNYRAIFVEYIEFIVSIDPNGNRIRKGIDFTLNPRQKNTGGSKNINLFARFIE
jgi:hypothetical protein